ncbi:MULTISPECIES: O-antigen ligase family protein [unclassified Pseudomonas]|uniref:O-antigen ligase family protein n=1 Tax=unclassified Pseudomonas TaxID=196821 RepID=UPI002114E476|nr:MULTISPECIES: O-antigen ligase family protein [unclassified Pseudomonas]
MIASFRLESGYWAVIGLLLLMPITVPYFYGHDWQRLVQVVIAVISLIAIIIQRKTSVEGAPQAFDSVSILFAVLLCLALSSCLLADQPYWAFCEVSLMIGCCTIAYCVAHSRLQVGRSIDNFLIAVVLISCCAKTLQFIVSVLAGYTSSAQTLDLDLLLEGFSNRRFYGQFQTLTLPLLAWPLILSDVKRPVIKWIFVLLVCWWVIAIVGGTRGTWLGMAVAAIFVGCLGKAGRRWALWQLGAMLSGLGLYYIVFVLMTDAAGISLVNTAGGRLTTSLSARDIIWHQAWEMIKARPLLGFGPMHFSNIPNPIAAHPHQIFLQWASEWGIPSTLLVGFLMLRGMRSVLWKIRADRASDDPLNLLRICLFASLVGSLTQGMVDGVIVMPYSQLWLAIVTGWLMGIHRISSDHRPSNGRLRQLGLAAAFLAVGFLGYVTVHDFPTLRLRNEQYAHDFGGNFQPRFWMQGVIASKPQ